jgi:probable addiction module antidote protein
MRRMLERITFDLYLESDEALSAYLSECLAENADDLFFNALGEAIRARGITKFAAETGISRDTLSKFMQYRANPRFETVWRIIKGLGLRLSVELPDGR